MNLKNFKRLRDHMKRISPLAYKQGAWFSVVDRKTGTFPNQNDSISITSDLTGCQLPDPVTGCTAAACLAGHAVYVKNDLKVSKIKADIGRYKSQAAAKIARKWLGITKTASNCLFSERPDYWPDDLDYYYGSVQSQKDAAVELLNRIIEAKSVSAVLNGNLK